MRQAGHGRRRLERVKWFLWHGNTYQALEVLDLLDGDFECLADPTDRHTAFATKLTEFIGYIRANTRFI